LRLTARRRLETDDRLGRRRRADSPHEFFQLRVAAREARRADLRQQSYGRQLRIRGQSRLDDGLVGVELGRHRATRPVPHGRGVQIAIEIAVANPAVNRVAMDTEFPRQGALAGPLLQVVPE